MYFQNLLRWRGICAPRYDSLLASTWAFCRSHGTQANGVVAAEVRNRIIWTGDEVRQRVTGHGGERLSNGLRQQGLPCCGRRAG
jgi:hypothetical protein